jgi:hypothetical protein
VVVEQVVRQQTKPVLMVVLAVEALVDLVILLEQGILEKEIMEALEPLVALVLVVVLDL